MTIETSASKLQYPSWVRGFDIITGLVSLFVGSWIFLDPSLAQLTILFLLAFALILIGFSRIVKVATTSDEVMKRASRVFNTVAGVVSIIGATYVFVYPLLAILLSIMILAISLLVGGIARLFIGATETDLPSWSRVLLVLVGLLTIGLSILTIAFPGYGFVVLILYIALTFIINGFTRLISGITGIY